MHEHEHDQQVPPSRNIDSIILSRLAELEQKIQQIDTAPKAAEAVPTASAGAGPEPSLSPSLEGWFTALWTKLQRSIDKSNIIIQMTSSQKGEGRTTITYLAGYTLAGSGMGNFLLIDCDVHHPSLPSLFSAPSSPGLLDVLGDRIQFPNAVQTTRVPNLSLLPLGNPLPLNQVQILIAHKLKPFLEEIRGQYDCIILDSPPIGLSALPETIGNCADRSVIVIKVNATRREVVQASIKLLDDAGIDVAGVILNQRKYAIPGAIYRRMK